MAKSYIDQILERAEKATEGPWDVEYGVSMRTAWAFMSRKSREYILRLDGGENCKIDEETGQVEETLEFIAHARSDVPELARRLIRACDELRRTGIEFRRLGDYDSANAYSMIADELEAMPEEK